MRNVLKCSTGHTFFTVKFWHFSSAAFIEKKRRTGTYASINKYIIPAVSYRYSICTYFSCTEDDSVSAGIICDLCYIIDHTYSELEHLRGRIHD